jgi:hypothetical protein
MQHVSALSTLRHKLMATTDNTNLKNLELYSILGEHDNAGFPLSYCMLLTATSLEIGKRRNALSRWVEALRDTYGIRPRFAHTDKDMGEISMLCDIWDLKIQLCWWHLQKAIWEHLGKGKLSTTPYNTLKAKQEFGFIDAAFAPKGELTQQSTRGASEILWERTMSHNISRLPRMGPVVPQVLLRSCRTRLIFLATS